MQLVLDRCRFIYNQMLEGLQKQKKPDRLALQNSIPNLKEQYPELNGVYSKSLQYECYRLFSNLRALSRLKKKGRKVGRLRFKSGEWFKTFTYNQSGFKLITTSKRCQKLHLSKIGDISMKVHRVIEGKMKQVTVKKYPSGKWYASISVEFEMDTSVRPIKDNTEAVGIDLGIIHFVYDSNGNSIDHPKFLTTSLQKLKVLQQQLARKKRGSSNRKNQRIKVSRQFEKVCNQRNDFLHKLSRRYVNSYDIISVENLNVKGLIGISYNARNISDASWSKFLQMLKYKAESAGIQLVRIEPRGTTQMCSGCEKTVPKRLWNRVHKCDNCGLTLDRDHNAAINILNLGLRKLGQELPEIKPLRKGTATDINIHQQVPLMKEEAAP